MIQKLIVTSEDVLSEHHSVDAVIIDGPAIVHMTQPKSGCTVDEYCKIYMNYVVKFFNKKNRINIVFIVYLESSLKEGFHASRDVILIMKVKVKLR